MSTTAQSSIHTLVIGAGSWGTALAVAASQTGPTLLLARDSQVAKSINQHHSNSRYLSEITLPKALKACTQQNEAIQFLKQASQAFIIFAVPVKAMRSVCTEWFELLHQHQLSHLPFVWTCKGFEQDTSYLPHEIIQTLTTSQGLHYGVLSGPSFAREVAQNLPVALTVASHSEQVQQVTTQALHYGKTRIYASQDIIGVEVGGALKNVIAIACGILDGLALGNNARAALITRGLNEIARLGIALNSHQETFYGLTGIGDLVLTATGDLSRNRQVGLALAKGQKLDDILATGLTAEGVRCARAALARAHKHQIEMPIIEAVCRVLFEALAPLDAVTQLLSREAKFESEHYQ